MSRESRPPCPSSAIVRLSTCSPARIRGSTRSNVVAWENIPHVGIPRTSWPSQRASQRRLPGWAGAQPARGARRRLAGANRALGDDQRRDLAFGDGLARLHWLPGEKGEDRHPLEHVHVPQRTPTDLEEPAAGRGERPLPAAVAFHLHAIADDRRRQPSPGVLLVEVTGLYREDVDLVPGRREQRCGGRRREARALLSTGRSYL